jgi:hypothetical protein
MMLAVTTVAAVEIAAQPAWTGFVRFLHITPRAFLPMRAMDEIILIAGKGIEGDRYMIGREEGFYSHKPEEGRQVTLFELETLIALKRDAKIELGPEDHRRNVTVEGVPLNHLVGRRFLARRNVARGNAAFDPVPSHRRDHRQGDLRSADQPLRPELPDTRGRRR